MVQEKYVVRLSPSERAQLHEVLGRKTASRFSRTRARIYLKADEGPEGPGWSDGWIADAFDVSERTVSRARRQLVEEGLEASLKKKSSPRPHRRRLDGEKEARLIALACGPAPEGHARWTLNLLAERMVALEDDLEELSYETVRRTLKKDELKPHQKRYWVIPPQASAEFVFRIESVLEAYQRPYNPRFPVVCMDETSKQLVSEVRSPIPLRAGHPQRYDYEYERQGVANLFLAFEPLAGWRGVEVTASRTRADWARFVCDLLEQRYPKAECVRLVLDNLNTHSGASFYELWPPHEARQWLERVEFVYTPSMGVGSTWPKASSASCSASAWIGGSQTEV